jgi:hypothetical protein
MERRVAKAKVVLKGRRDRRVEIREKLEYYRYVQYTSAGRSVRWVEC